MNDQPEAEHLAEARAAFARGEWRTARTAFELARERGPLPVTDAVLAARAAWYLGDSATLLAETEEAYQRVVADGDTLEAAQLALRLGLEWGNRGEIPLLTAWVARARRLLMDAPECPTHGYLRYAEGTIAGELEGETTGPLAAAEEIEALATRFDDPVLACFANVLRGLGSIREGDTSAGFERLDDAMLPVLAGQVDPVWAGDIFCTVIHACDGLGDLARMRSWTDALQRWASPLSQSFVYSGVTRVHHLQLQAAEGNWDLVEAELGGSSAELEKSSSWVAGAGFVALGDVRRLRGDVTGANEAYSRAEAMGVSAQPGTALLRAQAGHPDEAYSALRAAIGETHGLQRARLLLPAVDLAIALGDDAAAEGFAAELASTADYFGTAGLRARAAQALALVRIRSGRASGAVELLESAARVYREQRFRHALGEVHEQLARAQVALGDGPGAAAARATARAIYASLGATSDLARIDGTHAPPQGGLTTREWEVLTKVAEGGSNRDVATALYISEKTVGRHLANIYDKLGLSSRTAAAAWVHAHTGPRAGSPTASSAP